MKNLMYSEFATDYDKAIQDNVYNAHLERPSLQGMLSNLCGKKMLDLGCGSGVYSEYLVAHGAEVTAIDASSEMIDIVRSKLGEKVISYVQDLSLGLPREDSANFDIVICPLTIHYIKNLSVLFSDVKRVLKSDGYFVFSTHHPMVDFRSSPSGNYFEQELVIEQWNTIGRPVEVKFYRRSLTDLFNFISGAGLCVVELTEGRPTEVLKTISPESYKHLTTNPNFLFIKCQPVA